MAKKKRGYSNHIPNDSSLKTNFVYLKYADIGFYF